MSQNAGWTDETEVNFDDVPDELVNLPDLLYVFDFAKVTPKKTKKGEQALEVVLKAASVHPSNAGEIPTGAKSLYETVVFGGDNLMSAKNLLKSTGVAFPKKVNFEILTELAGEIMNAKQV